MAVKMGLHQSREANRNSSDDKKSVKRRSVPKPSRSFNARRFAQSMRECIHKVQAELPRKEKENYSAIARGLNERGHRTSRGGKWIGQQVKRTLETLAEIEKNKARKAASDS